MPQNSQYNSCWQKACAYTRFDNTCFIFEPTFLCIYSVCMWEWQSHEIKLMISYLLQCACAGYVLQRAQVCALMPDTNMQQKLCLQRTCYIHLLAIESLDYNNNCLSAPIKFNNSSTATILMFCSSFVFLFLNHAHYLHIQWRIQRRISGSHGSTLQAGPSTITDDRTSSLAGALNNDNCFYSLHQHALA